MNGDGFYIIIYHMHSRDEYIATLHDAEHNTLMSSTGYQFLRALNFLGHHAPNPTTEQLEFIEQAERIGFNPRMKDGQVMLYTGRDWKLVECPACVESTFMISPNPAMPYWSCNDCGDTSAHSLVLKLLFGNDAIA